ncbi:MotE family protein [Oceanobacillus sp. CF4.6]|uniref:MotE family protein n=1 Tax=Oceanobacillus sp. CF4.6 TaxID=3373080 RepID=UPI003EE6AC49
MVGKTADKKKKMNPFLWFIFAIVFPLIITITLVIVVMGVAGINVIDWAKEKGNTIPVISDVVTTEEEKVIQLQEKEAQAVNDDKDNEILELNQNITDLEATINLLEQEILKLENNQSVAVVEEEEESIEEGTGEQGVDTVISSYEEMKSKQAASILQNMETEPALLILQEVSDEARGDILETMDPETAAEFTQLLISNEN